MTKSGTEIKFKPGKMVPMNLLQTLLENGWTYDEGGQVWYVPLHDDGMFNWEIKPTSAWREVLAELEEKARLGELVAIDLVWTGTMVGGQFLFGNGADTVSINWNVDRKPHPTDPQKTDLEWYEKRLFPGLLKAGCEIEAAKSQDEDSGGEELASNFYDLKALEKLFGSTS